MTLDAMHWVWDHSQSKGNARLAVLYVADQVRTSACEVRVPHREFMKALNTTSKATAEAAVRKAVDLRELEIIEESSGRRGAKFRLSKAVGYVRPRPSSAPDSGAQGFSSAPDSGAQKPENPSGSAPESGAQGSACAPTFGASAPETGAPPHTHKEQASGELAGKPDAFQICQPLVQAMTEAGMTVSWSMKPSDWIEISHIVQRAGIPAMVAFARDTKATARQPIRYATFFLRGGWAGLPPATSAPAPRDNARRPANHCGHADCDPVTRTREIEHDNGLRTLERCPDCHPASKGQAA